MKSGLPEVCWLAELRKERGGSVFRLSVLRCSYQDVQARGASREAICKAVYMLYAADAGVMSKSADELARMMTVVVDVFREFGLTVSEKAETLNMRVKEKQPPPLLPPPLIIEAAGQRGTRRRSSFGTWVASSTNTATSPERSITGATRLGCASEDACMPGRLFDRSEAPFRLKIRLLKAETIEALLYACMTWSPRRDHYRLLQTIHHPLLLRGIGYRRK